MFKPGRVGRLLSDEIRTSGVLRHHRRILWNLLLSSTWIVAKRLFAWLAGLPK